MDYTRLLNVTKNCMYKTKKIKKKKTNFIQFQISFILYKKMFKLILYKYVFINLQKNFILT